MCINVCEIVRIEFCVCVCVNVKVKVKVMYQIQHEYIKNVKPSETEGLFYITKSGLNKIKLEGNFK